MKRVIGILFLVLLITGICFAVNYTYSSGLKSASGVISPTPVLLTDLAVYTNGTDNVTAILYDNASSANGTVIGKITVPGTALNGGLYIPVPVKTQNGIYLSLSGTGANAIVFWTPE